jgi:hypothetical protein
LLRYVLFDTTYFAPADNVEQTRKDLMWLLEALAQRDQSYLAQRPQTPALYRSGVKYEVPKQFDGECDEVRVLKDALGSKVKSREVRKVLDLIQEVLGGERFRDIGRILENGGGDCDNLSTWRVAELRQAGIPARPYMTNRQRLDGGTTYHALVMWPPFGDSPHWTSEDPSLLLGMSQPERAADRNEEIRKNRERCDLIRRFGVQQCLAMANGGASSLEDVLGLRRPARPDIGAAVTEIERLLKGAR